MSEKSEPESLDLNSLLWEALPKLALNVAQTAALCGISVRQLGYWTRQGYLSVQGQGTRRTYGLEAVRRVLAIRRAMDGGVSLRQALRLVPHGPEAGISPWPSLTEYSSVPTSRAAEFEHLVQGLRGFFEHSPQARDHAGGLAVKLGRAEADVRHAAEHLCLDGFLRQHACQEMTIFHQAETGAAHG